MSHCAVPELHTDDPGQYYMSAFSGALPASAQRRYLYLGERPSFDVSVRQDNEPVVISLADLQLEFSLFYCRLTRPTPYKNRQKKIE